MSLHFTAMKSGKPESVLDVTTKSFCLSMYSTVKITSELACAV